MKKTLNHLLIISAATIILTFLIWIPHFLSLHNFWGLNFQNGFNTIYRNFDGLEYITIAKTFYNPSLIAGIPQPQPPIYFASHFPGYAIAISLLAPISGYLHSMLFVSIIFTILSAWAFYFLVRDFKLCQNPLFISLVFLILPARWLITHSVGSSEPMFIFLCITTFYFLMKDKFLLAAVFGVFAQVTRPPGILLFVAIGLYAFWMAYQTRSVKKFLAFYPFILIPMALISIFYLFSIQYQDFWAYFHSGDNIHLNFPPFQVFNKEQFWVGDIWLEDIVYIFVLGFLGGVVLWRKKLFAMSLFVLTFMAAVIFVAHRDASRYLLPGAPFVLIAFERALTSKEFKIILPIILAAIYLYSQNFILNNVAPVPDLSIYN